MNVITSYSIHYTKLYEIGYLSYSHARNTGIASQKGVVADTVYRTDMNLSTKARYIMESVRSMAESDPAKRNNFV